MAETPSQIIDAAGKPTAVQDGAAKIGSIMDSVLGKKPQPKEDAVPVDDVDVDDAPETSDATPDAADTAVAPSPLDGVDDRLLKAARAMGYDDEDLSLILSTDREKGLRILRKADAKRREIDSVVGRLGSELDSLRRQQATKAADDGAKSTDVRREEIETVFAEILGDEKAAKLMASKLDEPFKEIAALKAEIAKMGKPAQEDPAASLVSELDRYWQSPDKAAVYGKGDTRSIDPYSAEYERRDKFATLVDLMEQGLKAKGQTITPDVRMELFQLADNAVSAPIVGEQARNKIKDASKARQSQRTIPASQNRSAPPGPAPKVRLAGIEVDAEKAARLREAVEKYT